MILNQKLYQCEKCYKRFTRRWTKMRHKKNCNANITDGETHILSAYIKLENLRNWKPVYGDRLNCVRNRYGVAGMRGNIWRGFISLYLKAPFQKFLSYHGTITAEITGKKILLR